MISVEAFIITRDRPDYLKQAVNSILYQQKLPRNIKIKIIISDNSISATDAMPLTLNGIYEVRKRGGSLGPIEHFNKVLSEVTADYFLMLHDDDFLAPNYFEKVIPLATKEKDALAIAVNGLRFSNEKRKLILPSVYTLGLPRILHLNRYYARALNCFDIGIPPVSGFLFSRYVSGIRYNLAEGGKHCDISFIGKIIQSGKVVQIKDHLLYVREHLSNDSKSENYKDRLSLIRYIRRTLCVSSSWWPFFVYRWQCSYRAIVGSKTPSPHLIKIRRILACTQLTGRLKSLKFLVIKVASRIHLSYLSAAKNEAFLKSLHEVSIKNLEQ